MHGMVRESACGLQVLCNAASSCIGAGGYDALRAGLSLPLGGLCEGSHRSAEALLYISASQRGKGACHCTICYLEDQQSCVRCSCTCMTNSTRQQMLLFQV
jgi:hypothetical protein